LINDEEATAGECLAEGEATAHEFGFAEISEDVQTVNA
jgi:hypothetical protein